MDNERYGVVYKATNLVNDKIYIGQTTGPLFKRKSSHIKNKNKVGFAGAIKKYGRENFVFEEIYTAFDAQELNRVEEFYILFYKSAERQFGYNIVKFASQGTKGYKHSVENIKKMVEGRMKSRVYKPHTEETKLKISQSKMGKSPDRDYSLITQETKDKISNTLKEKYKNVEYKEKASAHLRNPSEVTKERMREAKLGTKMSEECRLKISAALKGKCNRWKNKITTKVEG